jgi:hypothetical protein
MQGAGGTFAVTPSATLGSAALTPSPCALAAVDIDGDGDLDLACASRTGDKIVLFRQTAPGTFDPAPAATVTHASLDQPSSIGFADFDLDGEPDLSAAGATSQSVCLFRQLRPWVFASVPTVLGGPSSTGVPYSPRAIDFDGDGDIDLLVARKALDSLALFYNSH